MSIGVFLLVVHLLICLTVYLLTRFHVLRSSQLVLAIVLLVPLWGLLCLVVLELQVRLRKEGGREVDLEKMLVNDEIHRSILMDEDTGADQVVPLEEALLVNDATTRRDLMMEVMYADPGDYVSQLQAARMNDDTEVVHYAVTALVELQKEYDLQFQRLERVMALDPEDGSTLNEAISLMERYLGSGLLEGNARLIQLENYSDLLARRLESGETPALLEKKVDADLQLGEYDKAGEGIQKLIDGWPQDERGYLYRIRYYAQVKDRQGIDRTLQAIGEKHVYLSPNGRDEVAFWQDPGQRSDWAAAGEEAAS